MRKGGAVSRFNIVERTMLICKDATAQVLTDAGERFDVEGIFDNAEIDFEHRKEGTSDSGGLKFKRRQPVFTTGDQRLAGISKAWRLTIKGKVYFCPAPYADGAGWLTLWLADSLDEPAAGEGANHGSQWR